MRAYKWAMLCKEGGFYTSTKSIDPGQPARSAQADLGRYFLITACHMSTPPCRMRSRMTKAKPCLTINSNQTCLVF